MFNEINLDTWQRKPYFEHFLNDICCTYSMTVNINITRIIELVKEKNVKLYPLIIHSLTTIVNRHEEYRTCFNSNGILGCFDEMNPTYTVFHKDTETFSNIWTRYNENFTDFYKDYLNDLYLYGNIKKLSAKENQPENVFPISAVPWVNFTSFNLNVYNDGKYLLPIFTVGKYFEQDNKILLPLCVQHHHAVADGYHLSRFFNEFQGLLDEIIF